MLIQIVLGAILAMSVFGASPRGTVVTGQVSDGATPVASAIVTISNRDFVKSTTTDGNGRFILETVPPGRYGCRISAHGYAVVERPVIVHGGGSHRNWINVTELIPADRQTVSVVDLLRHQPPIVVPQSDPTRVGNGQESFVEGQ
jgi:hypothetical protein